MLLELFPSKLVFPPQLIFLVTPDLSYVSERREKEKEKVRTGRWDEQKK